MSFRILFSVIMEVIIHFCNIIKENPNKKDRLSFIICLKSFFRFVLLFKQKNISANPSGTIGAVSRSKKDVNMPVNKNILYGLIVVLRIAKIVSRLM